MSIKLLVAGSLALTITACASTPRERVNEGARAKLATMALTGERLTCLPPQRSVSYTAVTESEILIRLGVNNYYLTETNSKCNGATDSGNRFELRVFGGRVCRNQIVQIVDNQSGFPVGGCSLGDFQELQPKPEDEEAGDGA